MVAEASGLLGQSRRDVRGTSIALVTVKGPASESHHLLVSLGARYILLSPLGSICQMHIL